MGLKDEQRNVAATGQPRPLQYTVYTLDIDGEVGVWEVDYSKNSAGSDKIAFAPLTTSRERGARFVDFFCPQIQLLGGFFAQNMYLIRVELKNLFYF